MKLSVQAVQNFTVRKNGNAEDENDDASSVGARLFAIADGATETSFSDRWAQSLVDKFIVEPPFPFASSTCEFARWLEPLQQEWQAGIDWQHLPWFAESKARAGAFATFLGMEFVEDKPLEQSEGTDAPETQASAKLKWRAMAVGDSCLFLVRDNQLVRSFPLTRAEQFNSRPVLVSSNPANNDSVWEKVFPDEDETQADDLFFLATDALSHWFLAEYEAERKPWETLFALKTNDEFESLVAQLRDDNLMRNDDTTLLTLRPGYFETAPVEPLQEQAANVAAPVAEETADELTVVARADDELTVVTADNELTAVAGVNDEMTVVANADEMTVVAPDEEITMIKRVSDKE